MKIQIYLLELERGQICGLTDIQTKEMNTYKHIKCIRKR